MSLVARRWWLARSCQKREERVSEPRPWRRRGVGPRLGSPPILVPRPESLLKIAGGAHSAPVWPVFRAAIVLVVPAASPKYGLATLRGHPYAPPISEPHPTPGHPSCADAILAYRKATTTWGPWPSTSSGRC